MRDYLADSEIRQVDISFARLRQKLLRSVVYSESVLFRILQRFYISDFRQIKGETEKFACVAVLKPSIL